LLDVALIGDQPLARHAGLAALHRPTYSAAT
jgi:hypothetical protein